MYDPEAYSIDHIPPVRPRVATAPVINRFDIRQDGDSEKVAGVPLKLFALEPFEGEIVSAKYGANNTFVDVTAQFKQLMGDKRVAMIGKYNEVFGGDPIQGVPKILKVTIKLNDGRTLDYVFRENAPIMLSGK